MRWCLLPLSGQLGGRGGGREGGREGGKEEKGQEKPPTRGQRCQRDATIKQREVHTVDTVTVPTFSISSRFLS